MSANDNIALPALPTPQIEAWSGKDRADENFPVGSFLIAKPLRPHIHAFYAFARNADDIADSPALAPEQKLARLDAMEAALLGAPGPEAPSATRLRASLTATGVTSRHAQDLLIAFRQDAVKNRYANWAELLEYCRHSAAPVGRHVLDLHGEPQSTWPASDALCASLQILNHLQDCASDLRSLDRCYIPQDFLSNAGITTDDIARPETFAPLRAVFDQMLTLTDALNITAAALPDLVRDRRLRVETAIITRLARRLTVLLRAGDPLATRVKLSKLDFLAATLLSLGRLA
jgi:farnesyl-diphosphate farnesyltransferase